jgi:hydroxyethylthiazole kinase
MATPNLTRDWLAETRAKSPLVHHLTNLVTINDCANVTLCIGASPVMSDSHEEADQLTALASALVLNMGTLNPAQVEAMVKAGKTAHEKGIPVVFDPVGAGATVYRQQTARRIMEEVKPTIVKGNLAEIKFLVGLTSVQKGVDSLDDGGAAEAVLALARAHRCVAAATGVVDHVSDGTSVWTVTGGRAELGRVTGTGCMTASLVGSLAGAGADGITAALLGILVMDRAGEISGTNFDKGLGMGHFRTGLFDAIGSLKDADLLVSDRIRLVQP